MSFLKILPTCLFLFVFCQILANDKDIVVIESYNKEYKWDKDYIEVLKKRLGSKYKLTFFEMDTKRLPSSKHAEMGAKAFHIIEKIKPALVILGDDAALKFLGPKLEDRSIKTVYLGINNNPRAYFDKNPKYITGVLERPLIRHFSEYVRSLIPKAKKILILFDSDLTSKIVYDDFFNQKPSLVLNKIELHIKLLNSFEKWKNEILNVEKNKYDAVVIGLYQTIKNENEKVIDPEEVITWTSKNLKKPPFAFWEFAVGKNKALGGQVLSSKSQGNAAADLVEKILNNPNKLPFSYFPVYLEEGIFIFSRHELARWKINLTNEIKKESIFID